MARVSLRPAFLIALLALPRHPDAAEPSVQLGREAPFSRPAPDLLRAAKAAPAKEDAATVVLLDSRRLILDDAGRQTASRHRIVHVTSTRGVTLSSSVEAAWLPWYQERPKLAARVVSADGVEHRLDAATITEASDPSDPELRILRAPLPAVAPGAVVETEVSVADRDPFFRGGADGRLKLDPEVIETRVVIEAPVAMPLKTTSTLPASIVPKREEAGGRVSMVWELGGLDAAVPPTIGYTTVASWSDVAKAYGALVDDALRDAGVVDAARGAAGPDARKSAAALLAKLAEVRAQRVPFGSAPLAPGKPAEVLARHHGDGKDLATLLVALLRAAGHEAQVALVRTGFDDDVSEDLPGLGSFRHALVLVPPALWIDPSVEGATPGTLPPDAQGRLALVIGPSTKGLIRTPEAAAADNKLSVTQEIHLAEHGPARVVETVEATGAFAAARRLEYGGLSDAKLRPLLERHVEVHDRARSLTKFAVEEESGAAEPFRMTMEAEQSRLGQTDEERAEVSVALKGVFEALPESLQNAPADAGAKDAPAETGSDTTLPFPHVVELQVRIVPPPGFAAGKLPEGKRTSLGPARFDTSWEQAKDGAVVARAVFDSAKRRYTPAEADEVRRGVAPILAGRPVEIVFQQLVARHLEQGKLRDAMTEARRLAELHPAEALHRRQMADVLLAAGLGERAVEEARKGVELEPASPAAHRALGRALAHDIQGRAYTSGYDMAAAEAAYRKALELDGKDEATRDALGELLEYDERGNHGRSAERLDVAQAVYREGGDAFRGGLARCLFLQEKFDDLAKVAEASDLEDREALLATAEAGKTGAGAAVALVRRLLPDPASQRRALLRGAQNLWVLRRYPDAARLLRESAPGSKEETDRRGLAEDLGRMKRHEEMAASGDPAGVVRAFLAELCAPAPDRAKLAGFFSRAIPPDVMERAVDDVMEDVTWLLAYDDRYRKLILDGMLSLSKLQSDGSEAVGYRVRLRVSGYNVEQEDTYFVVREEGGYRIAGMAGHLEWLSLQAQARLDRGDVAGAKKWLDWARESMVMFGAGDQLAGPAFTRLWAPGQLAGPDEVRRAVWGLMAMADPARALPHLTAAREKADAAGKVDLDMAIGEASYELGKRDETLQIYRSLAKVYPRSVLGFLRLAFLYEEYGMTAELQALAEARLRGAPTDTLGLAVLASAATARGDYAKAQECYGKLSKDPSGQPLGDREIAENALLAGRVAKDDLERAKRAAEKKAHRTFASKAAALHLLAAVQAELGHLADARETLLWCFQVRGGQPAPDDWFVVGRIAEAMGERDAAKKAYEKVVKPEQGDSTTAWTLARRRLAILGVAQPGAKPAKPSSS